MYEYFVFMFLYTACERLMPSETKDMILDSTVLELEKTRSYYLVGRKWNHMDDRDQIQIK